MGESSIKIEEARHFSAALLADINALLPQLSRSASALTEAELSAVIDSEATHLLLAVEGARPCGMLTLVVFRIPTGVRAWVEDVVIDEAERGKGIATHLLEAAIALAGSEGAKTLDLTSRPAREAANRLYRKVGFEQRETNVYRLVL